jgi:hypothetical protein
MAEEGFKRKLTAFRTSNLISLSFHSFNPNRFLKRRYEMKVIRIIATILVFAGIAFIFACSEEKTASLEGNEDIAAVIQKLPDCYDNPDMAMEIYTDDAILMRKDAQTGKMVKLTGAKEIGDYKKEVGKSWGVRKLSIHTIKREADKAHVEYSYLRQGIEGKSFDITLEGSAELVKKGQTWKIKQDKLEY